MKKPSVKLWSVKRGELADFEVSVDGPDVVATLEGESIKFPGGISKEEFLALVDAHNEANHGVKGITEEELQAEQDLKDANQNLIDSL